MTAPLLWAALPPSAGATTTFLLAAAAAFVLSVLACGAARGIAVQFDWLDRPGGHKGHARPVPLGGGLAMAFAFFLVAGIGGAMTFPLAANEVDAPATADGKAAPGSIANADRGGASRAVAESTIAENTTNVSTTKNFSTTGNHESSSAVATHPGTSGPAAAGGDRERWKVGAILAGAAILAVLGLFDDLGGLDWKFRLVVQTAVAGGVSFWLTPTPNPLLHGAFVFWTVGLVNAFNMLDNMDGLSGGTAAAAAAGLACAALAAPPPLPLAAGGLAATLGGAILGFLVHNAPPARLYMGDAGAYLLGFVLAVSAVDLAPAGRSALGACWLLAGTFVVPWYDLVTVAAVRLAEGRSPFRGDQCHLSHRLVARGLSRPGAVGAVVLPAILASAAGAAGFASCAGVAETPQIGVGALGSALLAAAVLTAIGWWDVAAFLKSRRLADSELK